MRAALPVADPARLPAPAPPARTTWARLRRRPLGMAGVAIVAFLTFVALSADFLASDRPILLHRDGRTYLLPNVIDYAALRGLDNGIIRRTAQPGDWAVFPLRERGPASLAPFDAGGTPPLAPGGGRLWGTDNAGRDTFARMVHGARVSLSIGLGATALGALLGLLLGLLAGYFGGWVDVVVVRTAEVVLNFPLLFLLLAVQGVTGGASLAGMAVAIGLVRWCEPCLLVRAEARRVRELGYVEAARALGAGPGRILWRHVLPNAASPLFVAVPFGVASIVLLESALSFLGFGAPEPAASWGGLMTDGFRGLLDPAARLLVLLPGLAVFVTVTAFNLVGEALRDARDPRLSR